MWDYSLLTPGKTGYVHIFKLPGKICKPDSGATAIKTINGYAGDVVVKKNQIAQNAWRDKNVANGRRPVAGI